MGTSLSLIFGYSPIVDDMNVAFGRGAFDRAVVVGETITTITTDVREVRTIDESVLPVGVYWFIGIKSPLLLQVGTGARPSSASEADFESADDLPDHALIDAYSWAEQLWDLARPVPVPLFSRDDNVLTIPDGRDVEVRDRRTSRGLGCELPAIGLGVATSGASEQSS